MSTISITNGFRDNQDIVVATDQDDWTARSTWSSWTNWATDPNDLTIQIDIDSSVNSFKTPLLTPFLNGDATIQLKTSQTGSFSGEEDTINFSVGTEYSYSKARYYRWTITITTNASVDIPRFLSFDNSFDAEYLEEYFDDLDLASLSEDSDGNKIVSLNSIGTVNHVQGTALQGGVYVVDDYVVDSETYVARTNTKTILNTGADGGVVYDRERTMFGAGAMNWQKRDNDKLASGVLSWEKNQGQFAWVNNTTVEFYFYNSNDYAASTTYKLYMEGENATSPQFQFITDSNGKLDYIKFSMGHTYDFGSGSSQRYTEIDTSSSSLFNFPGWHHVAIETEFTGIQYGVVPGTWTTTLFVDGAVIGTDSEATGVAGSYPGETSETYQMGAYNDEMIPITIDEIRWSDTRRYSGSSFVSPTEFRTDANTFVLLHGDTYPFVDDNGDSEDTDPYIVEQKGGAVVIQTKNPLTIKVVDYIGDTWDGTVDLMVRGLGGIQMQSDYSVTKA